MFYASVGSVEWNICSDDKLHWVFPERAFKDLPRAKTISKALKLRVYYQLDMGTEFKRHLRLPRSTSAVLPQSTPWSHQWPPDQAPGRSPWSTSGSMHWGEQNNCENTYPEVVIYCHASRSEHFNLFNRPRCVGVPGYSTALPVHTGNKAHDWASPLGCVVMHINSNDHQEFLVGQIHF